MNFRNLANVNAGGVGCITSILRLLTTFYLYGPIGTFLLKKIIFSKLSKIITDLTLVGTDITSMPSLRLSLG